MVVLKAMLNLLYGADCVDRSEKNDRIARSTDPGNPAISMEIRGFLSLHHCRFSVLLIDSSSVVITEQYECIIFPTE